MGPTFVHTHRDENSYLRFFSALDRMIPNFRYQMQAIGSDGDEATMNAIASEKFKSHLIKAVTDQAQLDGHFSNNRVESTNNNVKDWVGRSGKVTLPVFNRKVEEYVTCQQQEFEMAIYANGPYDLASTHTYLRKERHIWNGLNADERKQVIKQFWKSNVQGRKLLDKFLLINEHAENRSKSDHSLPKPESRPNVSSKRGISYDDYQLQIPGISEDLLKEMFEKGRRSPTITRFDT
ncbi:unnamed protein product [Mytilus coruscus]|uniref:Uncharacterized protein n=1 Tax=Mytilus coruscus TaxID=42192 RepID=A0A6J8A9H1_MYTCO|nr:unnamed protein product [Mytilus coruscus]